MARGTIGKLIPNGLGRYFSGTLSFFELEELFPEPLPFNPPIVEKEIITPEQGRVKISGCFLADSPFEYIVIGIFMLMIKQRVIRHFEEFSYAYYLIDDVSVIETPLQRIVLTKTRWRFAIAKRN